MRLKLWTAGVSLAGMLGASLAGCGPDRENVADRAAEVAAPSAQAAVVAPKLVPAPPEFQRRIESLAAPFAGDVGVAVRDVRSGWTAAWQGDKTFPQQSTMKVWLAVAVLDAVDRGQLSLDEVVSITPGDLSVFNSPMVRPMTLRTGRMETTVDRLLLWALSKSDNAATDILIRRAGGGPAVQAVLDAKGLRGVRVGVEQRVLQPRISGLEWTPEYIDGDLFDRARDRMPDAARDAALAQYLRAPPDGATPVGTVNALEALATGKLISPASTDRLLTIMSESRAGAARLKAGTPEGWRLSHKTGTGQDWRRTTAGYNDVGLMAAPDGRVYAVAVYIGRTERPVRERQELIAGVARAVAEQWLTTQPAGTRLVYKPRPGARPAPPPLDVVPTVVAETGGPETVLAETGGAGADAGSARAVTARVAPARAAP